MTSAAHLEAEEAATGATEAGESPKETQTAGALEAAVGAAYS